MTPEEENSLNQSIFNILSDGLDVINKRKEKGEFNCSDWTPSQAETHCAEIAPMLSGEIQAVFIYFNGSTAEFQYENTKLEVTLFDFQIEKVKTLKHGDIVTLKLP